MHRRGGARRKHKLHSVGFLFLASAGSFGLQQRTLYGTISRLTFAPNLCNEKAQPDQWPARFALMLQTV